MEEQNGRVSLYAGQVDNQRDVNINTLDTRSS